MRWIGLILIVLSIGWLGSFGSFLYARLATAPKDLPDTVFRQNPDGTLDFDEGKTTELNNRITRNGTVTGLVIGVLLIGSTIFVMRRSKPLLSKGEQ